MKTLPRPATLTFVLATFLVAALSATAQEWTRFRGPNGTGLSSARGVPVSWTEKDYAWRVPIAGASHSQPVIWGERLFLLTALDAGKDRALLCLRKSNGQELWRKTYALPTPRLGNRNTGYANTSPVVDAERVIACFVSRDHFWVRAFDHAGTELWSRDLGIFESQHGHGASPIIHDGRVIVTNDQDGTSSVVALDLKTGAVVWTAPRAVRGDTNVATSYGTPVVHRRADGADELLLSSHAHGLSSLDPRTGALNWESPVFDKRMVASPLVAGDFAIGSCGSGAGTGNYLSAI
eukprot:gene13731-18208_t